MDKFYTFGNVCYLLQIFDMCLKSRTNTLELKSEKYVWYKDLIVANLFEILIVSYQKEFIFSIL